MPETITIALISLAGMVIVALINMIANNSTSKKPRRPSQSRQQRNLTSA